MATAELSVLDCGARGDGTTDDTAAFQRALADGRPVRVPVTSPPQAGYRVGTVHLRGGSRYGWQTLKGDDGALLRSAAPACLSVDGGFVQVGGLVFDMPAAPANSAGVLLNNVPGRPVSNVRLSGLYFGYCASAFRDQPAGTLVQNLAARNYVNLLTVKGVTCQAPRGTQVKLLSTLGFTYLRDVTIDAAPLGGGAYYPLLDVENFGGVYVTNLNVGGIGLNGDRYSPTNFAVVFRNGQKVEIDFAFVDQYLLGSAFAFDRVTYPTAGRLRANCRGHSVWLQNCTEGQFDGSYLYNDEAGGPAGANGLLVASCRDLQFNNTMVRGLTGAGVSVLASANCSFANVHTIRCGARGLSVDAASRPTTKVSGDFDEV